jgi:hypothetical protein
MSWGRDSESGLPCGSLNTAERPIDTAFVIRVI